MRPELFTALNSTTVKLSAKGIELAAMIKWNLQEDEMILEELSKLLYAASDESWQDIKSSEPVEYIMAPKK